MSATAAQRPPGFPACAGRCTCKTAQPSAGDHFVSAEAAWLVVVVLVCCRRNAALEELWSAALADPAAAATQLKEQVLASHERNAQLSKVRSRLASSHWSWLVLLS